MTLRWTREATQQLAAISAYISKDNPTAARRQVVQIIARAEKLVPTPLLGRVVPELNNIAIRELLERPYRIIYTVIAGEFWILTIWHYRRLLKYSDFEKPLTKC